ncbi:biliverdin-producing heme oxygenase [Oceanimonas marisflavi]|uniref:biliverdin-producing heme oxygenase n=1 Tax=Oceanimonas marisflavi TaxID=2059724 RepID=UPI000D2FADAE|nr:biliverdin-producing heme oxygenase [Oceanimonas marisflavi]
MNVNSPLAALLRQATREAHRQLDQHRLLRPLLDARLTHADYLAALSALYPGQRWLEQGVQAGLQTLGLHYPLQLRASMLAADLAQLHQPVSPGDEVYLAIANPAQLIGCLYVLEGARMGSRVIARQVRRTLGQSVPMRFFSAAEDTDADWPRLWQFAEHHCSPALYQNAADAARTAFEGVLLRLEQRPVKADSCCFRELQHEP